MDKTFYHTFLLYKIRQTCKTDVLDITRIKEVIRRVSTRNGGLPKSMVKYLVDDLLHMGLIEKISNDKYRILHSQLESKIKALMMAY